jgi:hypothetical protein
MRTPGPVTPTEEISGLVERVTYFNEESGFAVLRVKVRGHRDQVAVLGSVPTINAGEWLTGKGCWVRDKEHGLCRYSLTCRQILLKTKNLPVPLTRRKIP